MAKKHSPTAAEDGAEAGTAAEAAFRRYVEGVSARVDRAIDGLLPARRARPGLIHDAMRYTALSGGKRLRPALVLLAFESAGGRGRRADAVAAAVEMVHAFSLIHDDLPCMDDDDFRRGRPSNHVVFGEGVAVLAGDALLAEAFRVLAGRGAPGGLGAAVATRLVAELADATGSRGVIGGQVLDVTCEGSRVPRATVEFIHRRKTGRLFVASLRLGGIAAGASPAALRSLGAFGEGVGFAFQIVDDILGAAGTFRELGRDPGRDQARGKVTWPSVAGLAASHRAVDRLLARARREAGTLPGRRELFLGFCDLLDRRRLGPGGVRLGV